MLDWMREHDGLLWALGLGSLVVFVGSLLVMPALVVRIPADYFAHERRPHGQWADRHPIVRVLLRAGKNLLGVVLVLAGIGMLLLPGQGLLTMLLGVLLLDFPGKFRFERWLVGLRWVRRPINALRRRRGREPLQLDA